MSFTLFNSSFFNDLSRQAHDSPRNRSNKNLHADYQDAVQRLFITMADESYVRPHRHSQPGKFECFLVMQGKLAFLLFDDEGVCTERVELNADGPNKGIEIPPHQWHCAMALTREATFFEVKPGPYEVVEDKDFAPWAPQEGESGVPKFLAALKQLQVGEKVY